MTDTQDMDDQPAARNQSAELALAGLKTHCDALMAENHRLTDMLCDVGSSWREYSHSGRAAKWDEKYGFLASLNAALEFYEERLFAEDDT